jgi:predicted Zn-ribbon and HTH transcriptional regulator
VREALRAALLRGPATARDLSAEVGLREKDVADHLAHLQRSLAHRGERLVVEPATCLACGFAFRERERLTRPGACPGCRSTRIDPPAFRIEAE